MLANITVHEPKPPDDPDSPLSFSMEGTPKQPPPPLIPFFWAPAWNSIQAVNKYQSEIAGPLRNGSVEGPSDGQSTEAREAGVSSGRTVGPTLRNGNGVRLMESGSGKPDFYRDIPRPFEIRNGQWLVVPLHHIFSSEELSRYAPAVAELSRNSYVALNPEDAVAIGHEALLLGNRLPVRIAPQLPKGVAGILAGAPPFEGLDLPAWHTIVRAA